MRIELRDSSRRHLGRIEVDPVMRPTRVSVPAPGAKNSGESSGGSADGDGGRRGGSVGPEAHAHRREVFLDWENAVDDAGHLRRCVSCGSHAMFRMRSFPQVTIFIVVLAFAGSVVAALGYAADPRVLAALVVLLTVDVLILALSRRQLVCYRCRTTYSDLPIARYHRRWDRTEAERHPAERPPSADAPSGG